MDSITLPQLFNIDSLAAVMIALVGFITVCVGSFASRYMRGDTQYTTFFIRLGLLALSVMVTVSADHLVLLFFGWCISNLLLTRLMIHKGCWRAAKASGNLAAKNFGIGALSIAVAFGLLYSETGHTSIRLILGAPLDPSMLHAALSFMLIGALTQSAIWPFHKWLISSLNSPTPVSAVMHAGLVNGGGFLLVRFSPLYLEAPVLLTITFVLGITTALIGTLWKLMQSDIKRMLACSTMGQMGFMLVQFSLGLFPAAVAHLVWHGMFKAYLFLSSGGAAQQKRFDLGYPPKPLTFISALICGFAGSVGFAYASGKSWFSGDTTLVLMVLAFLAASQFALPMLRQKVVLRLPLVILATVAFGLSYGYSVHLIAWAMEPMELMRPQPLNAVHAVGMVAMTLAWLSILFVRNEARSDPLPNWMKKQYVKALNASQPHPTTVTAHRNHYQYL